MMSRSPCSVDMRSFGLRMTEKPFGLSSSCVFPLRLHASIPRTYNSLFSLMSASCLCRRKQAQVVQVSCHLHPLLWLRDTDFAYLTLTQGSRVSKINARGNFSASTATALLHLSYWSTIQRLGAEQGQLPCGPTETSSGN